MHKKLFIITLVIFVSCFTLAQNDFTSQYITNINDSCLYINNINTAFRPITGIETSNTYMQIFKKNDKIKANWFVRKLFYEHLFIIGNDTYKVYIDPVFDFRYLRQKNFATSEHIGGYQNTRGFFVQAKLGDKVFLNSSFYENQANLPAFYENIYSLKGNIPGYARVKKLGKYSEFDYANAYGNISFRPIQTLTFTMGYDRLFVGDGYNSLILSDHAAPMPYIKIDFNFGKWQYTNFVAKLTQFATNVETATKNSKIATYNMLTFNPQNGWQFMFLEQSVIDYRNQNFAAGLLRGVPLVREFVHNKYGDNIKIATNIAYNNKKIGIFYTQFAFSTYKDKQIDENLTYENDTTYKPAFLYNVDFQIGYKNHKLFNVKRLFFLAECNFSACLNKNGFDFDYDYASINLINSNFYQSLTIPQNKNAILLTTILSYSIKCFKIMAKYEFSPHTKYFSANTSKIYPDMHAFPNSHFDFQIVYEMNPTSRMQWFTGISLYNFADKGNNYYANIGFRTALRNYY